jgi:hypothetical protein
MKFYILKEITVEKTHGKNTNIYIYRERERELDYGVLQIIRALCTLHYIINFKLKMIDLN